MTATATKKTVKKSPAKSPGSPKMKARVRSGPYLEFPCMTFKQAGHELIFFVANGKELWSVVEINQRPEDEDVGYQRAASPSRVSKIADYIDLENVLPTTLVINFEEGEIIKGKVLRVPNRHDAGWVIDGQHRLAGAHAAKRDIQLPAVATIGLELNEQIELFVTINREQKGVPASLYLELLEKLPKRMTDADVANQMATELARSLKSDEESPFYARIVSTTSPKAYQISTTNFVRKVAPHLKKGGRFRFLTHEQRQALLNNYYKALATIFPREYRADDSVFFKTVGFGALINALPSVFDLVVSTAKAFKLEDVVEVLRRIEGFDFTAWRQMGTGNAAELQAGDDLQSALRDAFRDDESLKSVEF